MAKELRCRDLGIDCNQMIRAETEEQLLKKVAAHALSAHGIDVSEAHMLDEVRAAIYEVGQP